MGKKYYRFYAGLLGAQERWLNRMAADGCRMVGTDKLSYELTGAALVFVNTWLSS